MARITRGQNRNNKPQNYTPEQDGSRQQQGRNNKQRKQATTSHNTTYPSLSARRQQQLCQFTEKNDFRRLIFRLLTPKRVPASYEDVRRSTGLVYSDYLGPTVRMYTRVLIMHAGP